MSSTPVERLRIVVEPASDHVRVRASGELDVETGRGLEDTLSEQRRDSDVLLDLREVGFVDSAGLRVLLGLRQHAARDGWWMTVVPSEALRRLLAMTGTATQFDLTDTPF